MVCWAVRRVGGPERWDACRLPELRIQDHKAHVLFTAEPERQEGCRPRKKGTWRSGAGQRWCVAGR